MRGTRRVETPGELFGTAQATPQTGLLLAILLQLPAQAHGGLAEALLEQRQEQARRPSRRSGATLSKASSNTWARRGWPHCRCNQPSISNRRCCVGFNVIDSYLVQQVQGHLQQSLVFVALAEQAGRGLQGWLAGQREARRRSRSAWRKSPGRSRPWNSSWGRA